LYRIKTFNAISERGLERFPADRYQVGADIGDADAVLLRSHKLDVNTVNGCLKAVARAGPGVNNVPVADCT